MKKGILLIAVVVLSTMGLAHAQEDQLGITIDATYVSKYIWRGFDLMDDKGSFQPSIDIALGDSGFSVNIWSAQPGSSGTSTTSTVNAEEFDYTLTYRNSAYEGQSGQIDYAVSYLYYDFPDMASRDADAQEINVALSWPNLCSSGIVPSYQIISMWPAKGGGANRASGGFFHIFGLGYDITLPDIPDQPLSFSFAAVYNDGTDGISGTTTADHDWSHILWGLSTSIECGAGTFTPTLYYQTSMDDSVNTEDEFWTGLSYTVTF